MSKSPPMVYVEWIDSMSRHDGSVWTHRERAVAEDLTCRSVGFVIHEDRATITLAGHDAGSSVSGQITIPKVALTKRRRVRVKL